MKNIVTILTVLLFTINNTPMASGQTFQKTFGEFENDKANSVKQTSDGGFIITGGTGNFNPATAPDVYLIKTDANGNKEWSKTFGGDSIDEGWDVQQTADGGYIITGETQRTGAYYKSVYLVKTYADGNPQWSKIYEGLCCDQVGYSVQQTTDMGYIIAGKTCDFHYTSGQDDVYLIKTDSIGDTLWTKAFGGLYPDIGHSVQQTNDGGYIVTGWTLSFGADPGVFDDVYLIKTNSVGDTVWTKTFGGNGFDYGKSVRQTFDNGYIITGRTNSFGPGTDDVYLIKTDNAGTLLWNKTFGEADNDAGNSVRQTADTGYVISGFSFSFLQDHDVYLIRTDALGDTLWTKTFGGIGWDFGNSVLETSGGEFVIAGLTNSFGVGTPNFENVYLLKTDANGNSGGCYEGNPVTVVSSPSTNVNSTATQIKSGVDTITSPATNVTEAYSQVFGTISGTVTNSAGDSITFGSVKLLKFIDYSTIMEEVNSAIIEGGSYFFNDVEQGEYYILAEADSSLYPNHIPTYYGDKHRWDSAWANYVYCGSDIVIIETLPVSPSDSGFCSGKISYGLKNKTGKSGGETAVILGDPAKGLDITISQNPSGVIMQHTTTNDSGVFSFGNLTSTWGYDLSVDIPGLTMDSTYIVTFTGPSDSVFGLDFIVDTTAGSGIIFIASPPTSIRDIIIHASYSVRVFPNPSASGGETSFEIRGGGEGEFFRLEISDITGRNVICMENIHAITQLDKGELTPGIYIYKVLNKEGLIGLGKLIINN